MAANTDWIRDVIGDHTQSHPFVRSEMISTLIEVGPTLGRETLETYVARTAKQRKLLNVLKGYANNIEDSVKTGVNIVLSGNTGTGKDHLCIGIAKKAFVKSIVVKWLNGVQLKALCDEAINDRDPIGKAANSLTKPAVLWLSDPVLPGEILSPVHKDFLYLVVDCRYRASKPTWMTLNLDDAAQANTSIGSPTIDRIRNGAIMCDCDWPSYRKPLEWSSNAK